MKLDLHVHLVEAVNFARPDEDLVGKVIAAVKSKGLDGLAITDHSEFEKGFINRVMEIVAASFDNEILVIPGQETRWGREHVVELFLPGDCTFRFIAHPGSLSSDCAYYPDHIHGLELQNGNWYVNEHKAREVARRCGLMPLSNSDAHTLDSIGRHYNEVDLEELVAWAQRREGSER